MCLQELRLVSISVKARVNSVKILCFSIQFYAQSVLPSILLQIDKQKIITLRRQVTPDRN